MITRTTKTTSPIKLAGTGRGIPAPGTSTQSPSAPRTIPAGGKPQNDPTFGPKTTETPLPSENTFGPRSIPDPNKGKTPPKPTGPDFTKSTEMMDRARNAYNATPLGYNPYMQSSGAMAEYQDMNPYGEAAQNAASIAASQGYQGMQNQLLSQGPMSAADRMNLVSQFNRQKIAGTLGAGNDFASKQNQNQMAVGQQNLTQNSQVQRANIGASNAAAQQLAKAQQGRLQNLYQTQKADELLAKKMAASRDIARAGASSGDIFSQIFGG